MTHWRTMAPEIVTVFVTLSAGTIAIWKVYVIMLSFLEAPRT
ncbi:hypothetical protein HMPREF0868_1650 [Mageeibacillus indolicus UPII9-5]|uniref:Uncharacterized protein n=1 Tax=Mageeibacillus indolicus (strain UPII9-5) TaxID=699246 RepID=E1PK58_MAGIU|nr:hypothetical protein HMPREF0868_1650 [Mageeibacillus indolicus UPII9-5]